MRDPEGIYPSTLEELLIHATSTDENSDPVWMVRRTDTVLPI
jgi:hypothetical protein